MKHVVKRNMMGDRTRLNRKKLRILFVSEYFYPRAAGGEVWSWELCKGLAAQGHEVTVLTTDHADCPAKEKTAGVTIMRLAKNTPSVGQRALRLLRLRSFVRKARRHIRTHRGEIDVIHAMAYGVSAPISHIARTEGIPCVTSVHSYFGKDWKRITSIGWVMERMEKRLLKKDLSATMHVPSRYLQERILADTGKKSIVIHNWLPDRLPKPRGLPKGTLLFVGSLERIKIRDMEELVGIAKTFKAPLTIIGKGTLEHALREQATAAKARLTIIPDMTHNDVLSYIGGASMVLVPSVTESFSLVALEAVAQGTPVSGTEVGIIPELPHVTYPPQRIPPRLDGRAQEVIRKRFSREKAIKEFIALYEKSAKEESMTKAARKPRVSVVMGVYNCERYVAKAIESILRQTFQDFEFLIIDDACTDGTPAILKRYAKKDRRIRLIRNGENLGLTKSLNKAIRQARGEFIARIDADDIALPRRFAKQVAFLDRHKDVALLGTCADIIDGKGKRIGEIIYPTAHEDIRRMMVRRSPFIHPSVMFRKSVVEDVGLYDETFRSAQDYEYFPRIIARYKGANLPERLMLYRWDFSQNEGFTSGKKQERNALRARFRMIARYGWPWWNVIYTVKPMVSYLIPMRVKKWILKRMTKNKE